MQLQREGDTFVPASPDATDVYEVDDETWVHWQFLESQRAEAEAKILAAHATREPEESEQVKALRAAGLTDSQIKMVLALHQTPDDPDPVTEHASPIAQPPVDTSLSPGQLSIVPEEYPSQAPCPRHKRGIHVPAQYLLRDNGQVDALCVCGHLMDNVPCPHQHQKLLGRRVVCQWCNRPLIGNAGIIEPKGPVHEGEQPGAAVVDVDRFRA